MSKTHATFLFNFACNNDIQYSSAFALTQYKVELLMISDISQAETIRQDVARYL